LLSIIPFAFRCSFALLAPQGDETNAITFGRKKSSRLLVTGQAIMEQLVLPVCQIDRSL
jgi:hypothetical protein